MSRPISKNVSLSTSHASTPTETPTDTPRVSQGAGNPLAGLDTAVTLSGVIVPRETIDDAVNKIDEPRSITRSESTSGSDSDSSQEMSAEIPAPQDQQAVTS